MKKYPTISFAFLAFLFLGVSTCKDEEPEPPVIRNILDVEKDFESRDISEGVHDETLEFLGGRIWNYRTIAPAVTGNQKYPLVIHLHGASGGAADAHKQTECYVEPGFENMEAFIISPNGGVNQWNHITNQEMVVNLVMLARSYWPIDLDKIVVTGYSNGGNGSWFFGETQSSIISAAIPMASSYTTTSTDGSVRVMPIPMYVIHGEDDDLFPVSETEDWVAQTNDAGSDVTLVIAEGLGHYEPCEYVSYLQDAVNWLETEVWQ